MKALGKNKIIIIAGVSAAVLVTALGVGLGVGLNTSSSNGDSNGNENPHYVADANHYVSYNGLGVTAEDISNGKAIIDGQEYAITKRGEDFYLKVPSFSGTAQRSVKAWNIYGGPTREFSETTVKGEGKNNYYDLNFLLPSLAIGVIRIPNDGKIYGGFTESTKENVDYEVDPKLKKVFPNGYEIGSFQDTPGVADYYYLGGINMLKLQELKTLLNYDNSLNSMSDVEAALVNSPTTTRFGFFLERGTTGENFIRIAAYSKPTMPSEIGYVPTVFDTPISLNEDYYPSLEATFFSEHAQKDLEMSLQGFRGDLDGSSPKITLRKGTRPLSEETQEVSLARLYTHMWFNPKPINNPILGSLKVDSKGSIKLDDSIKTISGEQPVIHLNSDSSFTMPTLLVKLEATVLDETTYATAATSKETNELLINTESEWLDYFKEVANEQRVKDLAKELGITIRFKVGSAADEAKYIGNYGVKNPNASEIFFMRVDKIKDALGTLRTKEQQFAPLLEDGILKTNLENSAYFDDSWRKSAKFFTGTQINQYGAYPFSKNTQIIAYNSNYLPNGLDLAGDKTIADYLYQGDLGNLDAVKTTKAADAVTDEQKQGLLVDVNLSTGGTVWAFDYYDNTKKDQQSGQQDIVWKKITRGTGDTSDPEANDYWSVFADPNLKDNEKFKKWVDHNFNSNNERLADTNTGGSYDKYALFNDHIGAIMINSTWVTDQWRSGEWRTEGTSEEKAAFAQEKIKFQSIPTAMDGGWFAAISSELKKDKEKQNLAEMYLDALTNPMKGFEFYNATSKSSARKDVDLSRSGYEVSSGFFAAIANTNTVSGTKYDEWWPIAAFKKATTKIKVFINSDARFYENVANSYKTAAINEPTSNSRRVFAPEDPDVAGS